MDSPAPAATDVSVPDSTTTVVPPAADTAVPVVPESSPIPCCDGDASVEVSRGGYGTIWIKILGEEFLGRVREALTSADEVQKSGSVDVLIPENIFHLFLPTLLEFGYKFHVYDSEKKNFVYYKWLNESFADRVPEPFTARLGTGAIVLSPDETKICLVKEGTWNHICGAVDRGETMVTAAKREVQEETGIPLDDSFEPLFVGGFQAPSFFAYNTSYVHISFVLKASADKIAFDATEVENAQWFDVSELKDAVNDDQHPIRATMRSGTILMLQTFFKYGGRPLKFDCIRRLQPSVVF